MPPPARNAAPTPPNATRSATNEPSSCRPTTLEPSPLDLLATELDRIARRIGFLDAQINAGDIEYDQAKAHLDDCLALAGELPRDLQEH